MNLKTVSLFGPLWVLLLLIAGGGRVLPSLLIVTIPSVIFLAIVRLLHGDSQLEYGRKITHIVFGVTVAFALNWLGRLPTLLGLLAFGLYLWTLSEIAKKGGRLPLISEGLDSFERPGVLPFEGAIAFCLGAFAALLVFEPLPATAGILVLAFGDGFASVFGKLHGHHKIGKKSLEGTLAGLLASFAVCSLVLPWQLAILSAVIGMGVELLKFPLDDNITIPLAVGVALTLAL